MTTALRLRSAARVLDRGGLLAYPTEAVYGVGCDPLDGVAVRRLLALKRRPARKGVIVIAATLDQVRPYLAADAPLDSTIRSTWPGPVTWVLPAAPWVPDWLTGGRRSLAVRVTAHPLAAALCAAFGDVVVSTSANRSGARPARTALAARLRLGPGLDAVLPGPVGGRARPSEIRDARTGALLRG